MKKLFNDLANIHGYHIHIYFQKGTETEKTAQEMVQGIEEKFYGFIEKSTLLGKVGPHLLDNYALHVTKQSFGEIVPWLQMNVEDLSILIHPETGNDFFDHLKASMWLGKAIGSVDNYFSHKRIEAR
jgi:DOPA 4,5-dioxygenase